MGSKSAGNAFKKHCPRGYKRVHITGRTTSTIKVFLRALHRAQITVDELMNPSILQTLVRRNR